MAVTLAPLTDRSLWVLRLSALLIVMTGASSTPRLVASIVLAAMGLLIPGMIQRSWYWLTAFAVTAAFTAFNWSTADNHVYLVSYWLLAVAIHQLDPARGRLARSARWMVGLVFTLAMVWKIRSPEFVSGAFFEFELLTDPRFEPVALWGGGLSGADLAANRAAISTVGPATDLASSARVDWLASAFTWGTAMVETVVALVFLLPIQARFRQASLLLFFAGAYVATPVGGFGFALAVMALAQTEHHRLQTTWIAVLAVLSVWAGLRGALL